MTIPTHIIELAIEGGWKSYNEISSPLVGGVQIDKEETEIICDPTFWKSLGKKLGWSGERCLKCGKDWPWISGTRYCDACRSADGNWRTDTYKYHAHRFYDLILTSQPTDKFWEELLEGNRRVDNQK